MDISKEISNFSMNKFIPNQLGVSDEIMTECWKNVDVPKGFDIKGDMFDYCFFWQGTMDENNFPVMEFEGKLISVKKFMWESLWGNLDPDFELLTYCQNARCVQPYHIAIAQFFKMFPTRTRESDPSGNGKLLEIKITEMDMHAIFKRIACNEIRTISEIGLALNISDIDATTMLTNNKWQVLYQIYDAEEIDFMRHRILST